MEPLAGAHPVVICYRRKLACPLFIRWFEGEGALSRNLREPPGDHTQEGGRG